MHTLSYQTYNKIYETNLRNYLRNNLKEVYLRNYLQDMLVNDRRQIKISSRIFVIINYNKLFA